ncbi:PepSY-like domain-containing protein [Flavobacterium sp. C4GT6]|uniref:PepSY-like domain-containing protein n=1 Tax=Flavobacterium sp. C4GT6 TaxID=3103818 RepID=UPI002ED32A8E
MKRYLIIGTLALTTLSVTAQEKKVQVPQAVQSAFTKKFPGAKKVEWSKEKADEYEAEFKSGGTEQSANFDTNGKWLETETEIKVAQLPASVVKAISAKYPGYKIEEAEMTEKPGSVSFYEVTVEKGETSYEVQLSGDGKIIGEKREKEHEDNDDEDND